MGFKVGEDKSERGGPRKKAWPAGVAVSWLVQLQAPWGTKAPSFFVSGGSSVRRGGETIIEMK